MNYSSEFSFPDAMEGIAEGAFVGAAGIFAGVFLIVYLLMLGLSLVSYVLGAVGMYRIAKRRGIHHAWLSWIPVGCNWLLGSISDHYQYVAKQKVTVRRRVLLVLSLIALLLGSVICILAVALGFSAGAETGAVGPEIAVIAVMVVVYLAVFGIAIANTVFVYIAYYDLFNSCKPGYSVLFLILGIIFPFLLPFFVFGCSGADEGMPVRRRPAPQIPDAEPWQAPQEPQIPVVEGEIVEDPLD